MQSETFISSLKMLKQNDFMHYLIYSEKPRNVTNYIQNALLNIKSLTEIRI